MSNGNMNNTGMNCANAVNGSTCSLEKASAKRNSTNNGVEFAAEYNPNLQSKSQYNPAQLASKEFKPNNQQKPVSERTAWN